MTRQESEDRIVPEGHLTVVQTQGFEVLEGGKAVSINKRAQQLLLPFATAECPNARKGKGVGNGKDSDLSASKPVLAPKAKDTEETSTLATMEGVIRNLGFAFESVAANKGAPGPDRRTISYVRKHFADLKAELEQALLSGTYEPGQIRRVWIPKTGGQRGLGIPNVIDRTVQEALRMELDRLFEPTFHKSSHGFRPFRSCHTAIREARKHLEEGYEWVVDIDLEKFFDQVCHQRLMARLAERVLDRRVLIVISRMLKAKVVLPDGMVQKIERGVPQGGPLSPLLSNIVLDEFDQELSRRGHRFVRYADDCNIYVRSERAGQRVMASLSRFIEKRLHLKVNEGKSAVAKPEDRHFLGFRLRPDKGEEQSEVLLSERSQKRAAERVRELTPRNWGGSLDSCIKKVNSYLRGWFGFFGICLNSERRFFGGMDAHIRRRLRAIQLKHWKRKRTIARKLIKLGVRPRTAWRRVYEGRKSLWKLSLDPVAHRGLRNAYFAERGLVSLSGLLEARLKAIAAPKQLTLWDIS